MISQPPKGEGQAPAAKIPRWSLSLEHISACNCDYGCPCKFMAPPTYGPCETANAWKIVKGTYGKLSLDGLIFGSITRWPGPTYQGGGVIACFLDERADPEQRVALEGIATGRAGGPIGLARATISQVLGVWFVPIEMESQGKHSYIRVPGHIDVQFGPIRHPVTGKEHRAVGLFPDALLQRREEYYSATWDADAGVGGLRFSYRGRHGFTSKLRWRGP
jgi:hypothetical protein